MVGLLVSTYAVCQLLAGPALGQVSDHVGRKPVLLVSQVGTFIGFIVLAYAPNLFFVFLAEKSSGHGLLLAKITGAALVVLGVVVIAHPGILSTIS